MRVAGIDLGSVRVGVALSDELGLMAHPRPPLVGGDRRALLEALVEFAEAERVERFVVGLPRTLDGREGSAARAARLFAAALERRSGIPVTLTDEWLTTREAHQRFRSQGVSQRDSRGRIDGAAAALILQSWLDRHAPRGS